MDPKVVSTKDFYGYTLPSKEWKDGLFSKFLRDLGELSDTNPVIFSFIISLEMDSPGRGLGRQLDRIHEQCDGR